MDERVGLAEAWRQAWLVGDHPPERRRRSRYGRTRLCYFTFA